MIVERIKDRFGSVLAFVLLVLFVMTLVTFAIASLSSRNIANVVGEYWEDRARYGAYSGVHRALTELSTNPAFAGGVSYINVPLDGDPQVQWSIQVDNNVLGAAGKYAPDAKTWIPRGCVWIHSVGTLRNLAASGVSSLAAIISPQRPVFDHAVFATTTITMDDDSKTYSYYEGSNGEKLAHLATNLITPGAITILDNSRVDGDTIYGVDPTPPPTGAVVFGGSPVGTQSGATKAADEEKVVTAFVPPFTPAATSPPDPVLLGDPTPMIAPGHHGSLRIGSGQIATLTGPGEYYFQGTIEIRGDIDINHNLLPTYVGNPPPELRLDPSITPENPAIIYYDGDMVVYGGPMINWDATKPNAKPGVGYPAGYGAPNPPRLLQIYNTAREGDPAAVVTIQETNQVSFTNAGLKTNAQIVAAEMYGALIVETATINNESIINFDINLRGVPLDGSGGFQVLSMTAEDKGSAEAAAAATTTTNPAAPAPPNPPATTALPPPPPAAAPAPPPAPPLPPPLPIPPPVVP